MALQCLGINNLEFEEYAHYYQNIIFSAKHLIFSHTHTHTHTHTHIYVYTFYIFTHICMYVCICVCIYIYVCVYIYTYIYIYIYTVKPWNVSYLVCKYSAKWAIIYNIFQLDKRAISCSISSTWCQMSQDHNWFYYSWN